MKGEIIPNPQILRGRLDTRINTCAAEFEIKSRELQTLTPLSAQIINQIEKKSEQLGENLRQGYILQEIQYEKRFYLSNMERPHYFIFSFKDFTGDEICDNSMRLLGARANRLKTIGNDNSI